MGAHARNVDLDVVGVVGAEFGEDIDGLLPVQPGLFVLLQVVMGVGEAIVCPGLVWCLGNFGRELQRPLGWFKARSGWPAR